MKAMLNVALCGILAIGLQANAASPTAITTEAMAKLQQNQIAKKFLAEKLGITAGASANAANVALKKLAPADQAAVLAAINAYTSKAVTGTSAQDAASNLKLAQAAFTTSTGAQVTQVAAAQGSVDTTVAQAKGEEFNSCPANKEVLAEQIAAKSGEFSKEQIVALVGTVMDPTGCDVRNISDVARLNNLLAAQIYANDNGYANLRDAAQRDELVGKGLALRWKTNNIAAGVDAMKAVRQMKCHYNL